LSSDMLVAALNTGNGIERDRVHVELLYRKELSAAPALAALAKAAPLPAVRLQALCVLDGLGGLKPELVEPALHDPDPHVRANAIRLTENWMGPAPALTDALAGSLLGLADDSEPTVRNQLALTLGNWDDARAGK